MLEIKPFSVWSQDHSDTPPTEQYRGYSTYLRSSHFKNGTLNEQTENEINEGMYQKAVADGLIAEDAPDEEKETVFRSLTGAEPTDPSFTNAQFLPDYLRSKFDRNSAEYAQAGLVETYLSAKRVNSPLAEQHKASIEPLLANQEMITAARKAAVDRGDMQVVSYTKPDGSKGFHFGADTTRESLSGKVDSLLALGALDATDLKEVNSYLDPLNGGVANNAQAVRADAAFRFLDETIKSDPALKNNFNNAVQKRRRREQVAGMTTGERIFDVAKQAIAIPFEAAANLVVGTGQAVGEAFGAEYAPEEAPASADLTKAKDALRSNGYSDAEIERYVTDYTKHMTGPVFRADNPASGIDTDSLGNVLLAPELINQAVFDKALESAPLNEAQKAQAPEQRKLMLERMTPEYMDLIVGESTEALDAYTKAKASGISDSAFVESWLNDPNNYSGFSERLQQFGLSTVSAVAQPLLGVFALGGSESAAKGLAALNREAGQRQKYSRLFGDEYGLGFQVANTLPQVGADILLSVGTGAAYTAAKTTASTGIKSVLRSAAKQAVADVGEDAALAVSRASTLTGSTSEAFSKMSQGLTKTLGLTEAYAPIAASSFMRSASSTYGQLYDELPEGMSHEEKHKAVLGTSMLSGMSTMLTVVGMGLIGRGGVEDLATGGVRIGGKTVPMDKLTYRQMKMLADETTPVINRLTDKAFQQALRGSMGNAYRNFFNQTLKGGFDESVEEMLDQAIQMKITDAYKNQDTPFHEFANQLWVAGVVGGALGGGMGAGAQLLSRPTENDAIRAASARYDLLSRATERLKASGSPVTASLLEERMNEAAQRLAEERTAKATSDAQALQNAAATPASSTLNPDFGVATEDPDIPRPAYTELLTDLEGEQVMHGHYKGRVVLEEDQAYLELDKPELDANKQQFTRIHLGNAVDVASKHVSRSSKFRVTDAPVGSIPAGTPFYQYGKGVKGRYALPDPAATNLDADFTFHRDENGEIKSVVINTARNFDRPDVVFPRTITAPAELRVLGRIYGFEVSPNTGAASRPTAGTADFRSVRAVAKPAQLEFSYDPVAAKQGKKAAPSWSIGQNKDDQPIISIPRAKQGDKVILLPPTGEQRPGAVQVVYKEDNTVDYLFFPNTLTAGQNQPTAYFETDPERIQQLASLYNLRLSETDGPSEALIDDGHARFAFLDAMAGAQLPPLPVVNPEAGAAPEEAAPAVIPVGEGQMELGLDGDVPDYADRVSKAGMAKAVVAAARRVEELKAKMPASAKADAAALTAAENGVTRARASLLTAQTQLEKATDKTRDAREATVATRLKQLTDAEQKLAAAQQAPSLVMTRAIKEAERRLKDLQDASARTEAGEVIHLLGERLTPEQKIEYSSAVAAAYPVEESSEAIINTILRLDPTSRTRTARRIAQQTYADFTPEQIGGALARAEAMIDFGVARAEDGSVPIEVAREIVSAGETIKSRIAAFQGIAVDEEARRIAKLVEDAGQALLAQYNADVEKANPTPSAPADTTPEETSPEEGVAITVDSFPEVLARFNSLIQEYKEAVLYAEGAAIAEGKSPNARGRAVTKVRIPIQQELRAEANRIINLIRQNDDLEESIRAEFETEVLRTLGRNFDKALSNLLQTKRELVTMRGEKAVKGVVRETGKGFRTKQEKAVFEMLAANGHVVSDLTSTGAMFPDHRAVINDVVYNAFTMSTPDLQEAGDKYYKPSEYIKTKNRMLAERVQELYPEVGYLSPAGAGGYYYVVGKNKFPTVYATGVKGSMRVLKKDGDPKNAADFTYVKGAYAPYVSSNRYTDSTEVSGIFTNNPVAVRAQLAMRMSIAPAPTSFAKGKLNPSIVLNGRQAVGYYMPWDSERTNPFYGDSKPVDPRFTHNSETSDEPQARVRKSRRAAEALFLLGMKEPSRRSVWATQFSEETDKLYKRTSGKLDLNASSKGSVDTRLPRTATGMDNTVIGVLKEYTVQFNEFRLAQLLTQYVAKQLVKQVRKGQELSPDMQAYMEAKDLGAISTKPSELKRIVEMYAKGPDGSFAPAASSVNITAFLKDIFSGMTIEEVADHVTTMYPDTTHPEVTGVLMNYAMKLLKSTAVDGAYYAAPTADDTMRRSFNRIANTQAKREQRSFWKEGEQVSFDELFDDELFGMENSNAIQSEFRGDAPPVAQPLKGSVGRAFEAAGFNVDPVWDGVSSIEPIRLPAESEDPIYYTRSELLTDDFRKAVRENPTIASLVKQLALKLDPELAVLSGVELLSKLSAKVYEGVLKGDPTAYQFVANLQSEQTGTGAIGKKLAAHLVLSGWLPPSKIYQAAYVGRSGATAGIRVAGSQITRLGFLSPSEHEVYVGATSDMTTEEILARGARARTASEIEQKNVKDRFTAAYGVNESEAARQNDAFMDAARLAQSTVMSLNRERYQAMAEASVAQRRVEGLRERLVLLAGSDTFTNAAEAIQAAEANKQNVLRSLRKESADLYGRARKLDKQIKEASESGATLPRLLQRRKEFSAMLAGTRKIPKNSNAEDVAARISGLDQVILRVEAMSHPEKMASMRAEARSLRAEGRTKANQVSEFKNMDTRSVLLRTVQELSEFNKKAVMSELAVNMLTKEAKEVLLLARTRPYQLLADLAKNDPDYLKAKAKISPLTSEERSILQRAAVEKLDAVRSNENLSKAHSALGKLLREAGYNVRTTQRQQGATEDLFVVPDAPVIPPPPAGVTEFTSPSLGVPAEGVVFQSPVVVRPEWETREKGFMWDRREVTHSVDEDGFISARVVYTYPSGETSEETLRGAKASDILVKREVRAEGEQTVIEYTYFDGSTESEIMDGLPSTGIEDSDFTLPPTVTNPNFRSEARTLGVQRARTAEAAEREAALARAAQVDQEQPADTEQPAEQAEEQQEPYFNQRQAAALSNPENFRPQLGRVEGELTGGLTYDEWQFVYDYYTQEREDAIQRENPEAFAPRLGRIDTEALAKRLKKNDQVTSRNGLFFSAGVFTKQTQAEIVAANKAEASRLGLVNGDASSVVTALRNIAKSGGVIQKAVANMLLANGDIVAGTKFVMTELNSSEAGFYSPEDNTVVINLDGTNGRGLADVLLHEYTHAGTIELLTRPRTAAQRDAIQRLTALRNLTSQIAAERGIDSAVFRAGLANNAEFISYALTAPEFQSILVNMSPPSQRSVWRRILDTIADFFGVSREQVNALDEILNFATMAFTTPNTFGTTSTLQSARDEDRRADEMNHDVMIARAAVVGVSDTGIEPDQVFESDTYQRLRKPRLVKQLPPRLQASLGASISYASTLDARTIGEALRPFMSQKQGALLDFLYPRVSPDLTVTLVNNIDSSGPWARSLTPNVAGKLYGGMYFKSSRKIEVFLDELGMAPERALAATYLHELVHAATIYALDTDPDTLAQINDLMQYVKQVEPRIVKSYGMANAYEFLAESLTSSKFQKALSNIPSRREGAFSVLDELIDLVKRFIGVKGKGTALEDALELAFMVTGEIDSLRPVNPNTPSLQSEPSRLRGKPKYKYADAPTPAAGEVVVKRIGTPKSSTRYAATLYSDAGGEIEVDYMEAARAAMPQGVEMVEDSQLAGVAGFSRANPTQIVVNPDYLAQAVRGLPAHRAAAVVRSTIDEEVAHMASDAVFSEADYADIAEMLGNSGLNLVAHEYYSLKYPSFAERSAAIRADRDSGILSDVTLASEWTRMQVSRMATGTTRERDLDMILDNKSLVDKLITALLRFVETLRERFALSPTASTAAKISQASRMMRRLQNDGAIPAPESSPEGEMGDTTYLLAALSNQTVEGQEDRTSFAAPIAAIDPDKKSFIERFWDKLGERGRIYNMPTALREVYNNRAGVLSTAQYDIQLFNKKFSKLRDSALADGIPMEDLMVVLGTTEPIIKTPVRAKIASDLRAFGRTLSPQDPAREDKMREKENELYQQAAHEFAADFRLKQEEMEKRLRSRGHSEVVDLMVEFRKQMNKQKTIVNWDSTNDVYLTRHYRYYDTPGWHMAVRNGTVFTDDTGTEVDFGARRLVAARSLYMEEAMADLSREGIKPTQDLLDQRVLVKLDEHLDSLDKMHAEEYSESMATSIRQDPNLLKKKREVDASLRELLGEVKDPLEVAVRTMHSLSRMAANKTFYENFEKIAIKQGLASYTPQDGMDLLFPSRQSDRYGTLAGLHARNDIAAALREELKLQLGQGEANATKAISGLTKGFATFSGLSITAKTALGVGYWTRNIIGGGVLSITQGLSPLSRDSIASFKAAFKGNFLGAESDENQREVIRRLTELQILRDDSQGRIITDMMRGFMTNSDQALDEALQMILKSQATGSMAEIKSVWSKLFSVPLEKVPAAAATLNNFVDSYFKANAYFQELRFLQNKFGETHSAAELEQRAAHKVKLTFPTHSQTLDITRAFNRSPWAQLFMPFLRYKTEIIRTMINTPLLAASEMKNGEFSRGLRRLTGYSTVMIGGASILGHTISMIFSLLGDDDEEKRKLTEEEQEQIRMGLPKWQRLHALHMTKIGGKIQVVDMNYIMPHSIVTGIFSIAMNGAVSGNGVSGRDVAAFIKSELLGANIAATAVNEVLSNRDDFGREIYSSSDNALEVFRKSMTHLGAGTLLPASIDKGRKIFRKGEKNRLELILGEFTGTRPQLHELDTVLDRGMRTVKEGIDAAVSERSPFTSGKYLDTAEIPDIFDRQQRMLNANQKRLSDLLRVMQSLGVEESTIFEKSKDTQISKQTIALAMDGQQLRYTPNAAVYQKMDANIKALGEEASADPRFQALIDYAEKQPEIYDVSSY